MTGCGSSDVCPSTPDHARTATSSASSAFSTSSTGVLSQHLVTQGKTDSTFVCESLSGQGEVDDDIVGKRSMHEWRRNRVHLGFRSGCWADVGGTETDTSSATATAQFSHGKGHNIEVEQDASQASDYIVPTSKPKHLTLHFASCPGFDQHSRYLAVQYWLKVDPDSKLTDSELDIRRHRKFELKKSIIAEDYPLANRQLRWWIRASSNDKFWCEQARLLLVMYDAKD